MRCWRGTIRGEQRRVRLAGGGSRADHTSTNRQDVSLDPFLLKCEQVFPDPTSSGPLVSRLCLRAPHEMVLTLQNRLLDSSKHYARSSKQLHQHLSPPPGHVCTDFWRSAMRRQHRRGRSSRNIASSLLEDWLCCVWRAPHRGKTYLRRWRLSCKRRWKRCSTR